MNPSDFSKALKSLYNEVVSQKQGVMTDVGPENARAYSAILAGKPDPTEAANPQQPPVPSYPNILPPSPENIPQTLPVDPSGGILASTPSIFSQEPIVTGQHVTGQAEGELPEQFVPQMLRDLSDRDLRQLVNQMHGVKGGQKGAVGNRVKRPKLLEMAAKALNLIPKETQAPDPLESLSAQSEIAAPTIASLPGYGPESAPTSAPIPAESHVARLQSPQTAGPGPETSSVLASATERIAAGAMPTTPAGTSPLPPSLMSRADTGVAPESTPRQPAIATKAPRASSAVTATPQQQPATTAYPAITAGMAGTVPTAPPELAALQAPPVSSYGILGSGSQGTPPGRAPAATPPAIPNGNPFEAGQDRPTRLSDAVERLTKAVESANQQAEKTVAQETAGMSWGERLERLEKSGKVLPEDEVRKSTLRGSVTPRDIVVESERREQQERDQRKQGRKTEAETAGKDLSVTIGKTVTDWVSRIAGPRAGQAAGSWAAKASMPLIEKFAGSGAATAAKGATSAAGMGGAVSRLGAVAAANPYALAAAAAGAVAIAFLKLPGAVERLTTSFVEGQRHLAKYNAQLMGMYTRLDYQKRLLDIQTAQATSGTGAMLGNTLSELRKETQWMREGLGNVANIAGTALVQVARIATVAIKYTTILGPLKLALDGIINFFNLNSTADSAEIIRHLRTASRYVSEPMNRKPPAGRGDGRDGRSGD